MEFQENYPIDKLIPYARNSRTHNDEQIAQIAASIKEFGFTNPILIGVDDVIIAGHGRLLAAQRMGLKEVPVIRLPHLSETQRRALVIADNKIALNAGWDEEMLALEMKELGELEFNLDILGFSEEELKELDAFGEPEISSDANEDEVPEVPEEVVTKPGDIWLLGEHRLLCGDTTIYDDVWAYNKPVKNDLHPTMKPVELVERAINNSSKLGDIVLDGFVGSGSTIIAAEKTGRKARLIELDPKFCDVIVRRWEEYTGQKAQLFESHAENLNNQSSGILYEKKVASL